MDYKHRIRDYRPRPTRKKKRLGRWVVILFIAAAAAGGLGWTALRYKDTFDFPQKVVAQEKAIPAAVPASSARKTGGNNKTTAPETKEAAKRSQEDTLATAKSPSQPELRFSFYKLLPEKEAIIPDSEIRNLKQEEKQGNKTQGVQYVLQVGSFTNVQDAQKLKARLSSLKIKSHIENVKIDSTGWNRVKIGPFTSLAAADGVRTILRNNQIDSVVQKAVTAPAKIKASR